MKQLFPLAAGNIDLERLYGNPQRVLPDDRAYVIVNMIATIDGGTAIEGVSGSLGGGADESVFAALRAAADVILVGRKTVEAEGYGPPHLDPEQRRRRVIAGKQEVPAVAIVSQDLDLDWSAPFFTDAEARPLVVTSRSYPREKGSQAEAAAEILVAGDKRVDLRVGLARFRQRGLEIVLCEGGPTLNASLGQAGVIDELCLTLSPRIIGGTSKRILDGAELPRLGLQLAHVLEDDGFLLLRYLRES